MQYKRISRLRLAIVSTVGSAVVIGGALSSQSAAARPNCQVEDPPPICGGPHRKPDPPATYAVESKPLDSNLPMPISNGDSEHVTTTVVIRRVYDRRTDAETQEWLVSTYHVVNKLALVGWTVKVHEDVFTASGGGKVSTGSHAIGVSPVWFDPENADRTVSYATAVPVGTGDRLGSFNAIDTFSN